MTRTQQAVLVLGAGLNSLVLFWAGVGAERQLMTWVILVLLTLTGKSLLGKAAKDICEPAARIAVFLLIGLASFTLVSLVLLHLGALPSILGSLAFLGVGGARGLRGKHKEKMSSILGPGTLAVCAFLAVGVAATSFYGFYRNPQAPDRHTHLEAALRGEGNWGWNADKRWWLIEHSRDLESRGLPWESHLHEGVPVFYLTLARLTGGGGPAGIAQAYKASGGMLIFALLILAAWAARRIFRGGRVAGMVAVVSLPLFSPISYHYLAGEHPWYLAFFNIWGSSSYLGFFPAGAGIHHNVTFFLGLLLGIGGGTCLLRSLQGKSTLLFPGAFLLAASLFFKPSFFAVAAPPFVLVFLLERKIPLRSKAAAGGIILLAAGSWFLYPRIFAVPTLEAKAIWQPFAVIAAHAARRFPPGTGFQEVSLAVCLLSFAVLVPIALEGGFRAGGEIKRRGMKLWATEHLAEIAVVLVFVTGAGSYALLAQEGGMFRHANFSWGAGMGYAFLLPFLAVRLCRLRPAWLAAATWLLYLFHLWGGAYHLYRLVGLGRIH